MFASGVPTAEKPTAKKFYLMSHSPNPSKNPDGGHAWSHYKRYLNRTSILFPIPPQIYVKLPQFVKTWVLLDLPMYQFKEEKDGQEAEEEERGKMRDERA